jgi:hypothetical protein
MTDAQDKHNEMMAPTDFFMFALDQTVYYMFENRIHSATVMSRTIVENVHDEIELAAGAPDWQPFGHNCIKYNTCDGILNQDQLYANQVSLVEDLMSGNPT